MAEAEWATIPVRPETKKYLEELKKRYRFASYDELVKALTRPKRAIQLDLSREIPPVTGILWNENWKEVPFDGQITQVIVHFPSGCNALVEVRVGVYQEGTVHWICPKEGFLALDDVTLTFNIFWPVRKKDRVCAEIYNYDDRYYHRIGITVVVEEMIY